MAFRELEQKTDIAIKNGQSFAYETNFNSTPLYWPNIFKSNGYEISLIYFCLDSIEEAKRRVAIRVENNGHHVPDHEIEKRYIEGYNNLDEHYSYFDTLHVFNSSSYSAPPEYCFSMKKGRLVMKESLPQFLKEVSPLMYQSVTLGGKFP
ncbi:hypothetical protein [Echinicola rosea]|uniref:Zeta toxin n=1 Tax=Echinicola rosea TaxID=1807691 RepID=A0ABQ1VBF5_9BACT|nr:hypothetical protein [Echinicola rosea]GGF51737.1 hypothetical protein GCM10011339_45360 [Echinicola rosea]